MSTTYDDYCVALEGELEREQLADDEREERAWLESLYATATTNGEDTVMGQVEQGPFGFDETSAVFTTPTEVGLLDDEDAPEFTAEECDAALTTLDTEERVGEALDAVAALPSDVQADALMLVAGALLNKLDNDRARSLISDRSCKLAAEDRGTLARQHILMLYNEVEQVDREISLMVERRREAEVALIQALGPCAGLAFEAAE